jgi:hypothetical protein
VSNASSTRAPHDHRRRPHTRPGQPHQLFTIPPGQHDRPLHLRGHHNRPCPADTEICQAPASQPRAPQLSSDTLLVGLVGRPAVWRGSDPGVSSLGLGWVGVGFLGYGSRGPGAAGGGGAFGTP